VTFRIFAVLNVKRGKKSYMADFNLVMPKLGESVQEATITKWLVKPGDMVQEDDSLLEIATDKVDSEIPSPVAGKVLKVLFPENALVPVGEVIAVINTEGTGTVEETPAAEEKKPESNHSDKDAEHVEREAGVAAAAETKKPGSDQSGKNNEHIEKEASSAAADVEAGKGATNVKKEEVEKVSQVTEPGSASTEKFSGRFYSPLVRSIAKKENISESELDAIPGNGTEGRVRKTDVLQYLEKRTQQPASLKQEPAKQEPAKQEQAKQEQAKRPEPSRVNVTMQPGDQVVEMDRMRKLIADHMVMSKHTSPHVTNFVEADVTNLVLWREKTKDEFLKREKIKLTFMPAFVEATARALKEYPGVNASVDGDKIILRKSVNIGFAVALKSGNLIVPVVRNADQKSMLGIAVELNRLAEASRNNSLSPDDIQGGTFTISNFGTFRNITGTPIINQPQVAILATGNIEKKPAVLETPTGDVIAIRHKMILSLSYDHRVVDGALGGMFLRRIADLLEEYEINRTI
jgi:2-oxoglutarate dehydrogenase E2 component (dihydrolipoamide succinyltransferase)